MADAIDRRTLALASSAGLWLLSMVLVLQSQLHWNQVWVLYAVVACQSACFAVNNPARSAIIPRLIRPALLPPRTRSARPRSTWASPPGRCWVRR